MKAKDFFRQVRIAETELKVLNAKRQHYLDLGISMGGSSGTGAIGNKNRSTSRVELAACGAVDAMQDLEEQRKRYLAIIARAEKVISQITQEKYRQILDYRYICGKSFRWISDELEYNDTNSIYRAHGWALKEAQKILNREEKEKTAH